ncbi:MAG: hypothetical protein ABIF87_10630 [Pseudomonadota bacterium]
MLEQVKADVILVEIMTGIKLVKNTKGRANYFQQPGLLRSTSSFWEHTPYGHTHLGHVRNKISFLASRAVITLAQSRSATWADTCRLVSVGAKDGETAHVNDTIIRRGGRALHFSYWINGEGR